MSEPAFLRTVVVVALTLSAALSVAQVSKPTAEDLGQMPGAGGGQQRRAAESTVTRPPSTDPRDISGTWSAMNPSTGPGGGMGGGNQGAGAPGGAGGPGGGQAGPGAPGGQAAAGGMSGAGGFAGGAPGGAGPAGGAPGGATEGNSRLQCFPSFTSFGGVEGVVDISVTDRMIVMVGQEMQMVRRIYMNAEHPKNLKPSFYGHSTGRWEGDTLVVDTVGIRSGNSTRSVQERIRKTNNGQTLEATQIENGRQGRTATVYWNPGRKFMEWICEDADEFWDENYK